MSARLRCPMCGRPLGRIPGLERVLPHSRGGDCRERHAHTTDPEDWERARIEQYRTEIQAFLHPADVGDCDEHDWVTSELNSRFLLLMCARCSALTAVPVHRPE